MKHERTLEQKVEKRTSELSSEIQTRKKIEADLIMAKEAAESANKAKNLLANRFFFIIHYLINHQH